MPDSTISEINSEGTESNSTQASLSFIKSLSDDGRPFYTFPFNKRYVIPGDIHFPAHDEEAVIKFTLDTAQDGDILFLQGDTGDQTAFSKFLKDPDKIVKTDSMIKEREIFRDWIERWLGYYEYIVIGPGNHGDRAGRLVFTNPAFLGLGWWWPYLDIFNTRRIILLDSDYRAQIGAKVFIEHGENLRGNRSKVCPAADVAAKNPGDHTIIFGHTHKLADVSHTRYHGGKKYITRAVNVGCLQQTQRQTYVSEPNWQAGAAICDNGVVELLHE